MKFSLRYQKVATEVLPIEGEKNPHRRTLDGDCQGGNEPVDKRKFVDQAGVHQASVEPEMEHHRQGHTRADQGVGAGRGLVADDEPGRVPQPHQHQGGEQGAENRGDRYWLSSISRSAPPLARAK